LGNPCRNEALPLWRGSKADTCGNSEARGESEKRTTELKGKQKKLSQNSPIKLIDDFPGGLFPRCMVCVYPCYRACSFEV